MTDRKLPNIAGVPLPFTDVLKAIDAYAVAYADAAVEAAVAAERELCARICDGMALYTGYDCAAAIRAGAKD